MIPVEKISITGKNLSVKKKEEYVNRIGLWACIVFVIQRIDLIRYGTDEVVHIPYGKPKFIIHTRQNSVPVPPIIALSLGHRVLFTGFCRVVSHFQSWMLPVMEVNSVQNGNL